MQKMHLCIPHSAQNSSINKRQNINAKFLTLVLKANLVPTRFSKSEQDKETYPTS